jgi:hypothetical protein
MKVEEDGCEILIPIKSVLCCEQKLRPINGFWRCPKCNLSYGPTGGIAMPRKEKPKPRPWYEWS